MLREGGGCTVVGLYILCLVSSCCKQCIRMSAKFEEIITYFGEIL